MADTTGKQTGRRPSAVARAEHPEVLVSNATGKPSEPVPAEDVDLGNPLGFLLLLLGIAAPIVLGLGSGLTGGHAAFMVVMAWLFLVAFAATVGIGAVMGTLDSLAWRHPSRPVLAVDWLASALFVAGALMWFGLTFVVFFGAFAGWLTDGGTCTSDCGGDAAGFVATWM
jgi:hypothetical protein